MIPARKHVQALPAFSTSTGFLGIGNQLGQGALGISLGVVAFVIVWTRHGSVPFYPFEEPDWRWCAARHWFQLFKPVLVLAAPVGMIFHHRGRGFQPIAE
jgi:hypothetical protein